MSKRDKAWLTVRLTAAERDLIAQAAQEYGMSVQNFIAASAEEKAREILSTPRLIVSKIGAPAMSVVVNTSPDWCRDEPVNAAAEIDSLYVRLQAQEARIAALEAALRALATTPAVLQALGREHTVECGCPLCRANVLLHNPLVSR